MATQKMTRRIAKTTLASLVILVGSSGFYAAAQGWRVEVKPVTEWGVSSRTLWPHHGQFSVTVLSDGTETRDIVCSLFYKLQTKDYAFWDSGIFRVGLPEALAWEREHTGGK